MGCLSGMLGERGGGERERGGGKRDGMIRLIPLPGCLVLVFDF